MDLSGVGLHPFHLPLGILLEEKDGKPTPTSTCIRCSFFDGFPCLLNGKADAQVICIDPMLARYPNVTLLTGAYVSKLGTDSSGRSVDAVHVTRADVRKCTQRTSSLSHAERSLRRCCCCVRQTSDIPTVLPMARASSGATTCAIT